MGLPTQEIHGPIGVAPEEGQKDGHRAGAHLLLRQAERIRADEPGEERALGRSFSPGRRPTGSLEQTV